MGASVHRVDLETDSDTPIVSASGELDAFVAPDLTSALERAGKTPRLVVDLASVSFLDSTALGVLVRSVREIRSRGGDVRVVLPAGTARRIFEITTLDRALPTAESRAQALEELGAK
jgi:anti-sigma B factor antagonist